MKKDFKRIVASFILASFISLNSLTLSVAANDEIPQAPSQVFRGGVQASTEHLPDYRKTDVNTVYISEEKATISRGNVLKIAFAQKFSTKTAKSGDAIEFVLKKDLKTKENRTLLPEGTKITGTVQEVKPVAKWNRNATALLKLDTVVLPNGQSGSISARLKTKNAVLKKSAIAATGKAAIWTVGLFGVGAGLGAAIGAIAGTAGTGCLVFGMPIGGGLGLIIGSATKGLNYNAKPGKTIYIELSQDLDICY